MYYFIKTIFLLLIIDGMLSKKEFNIKNRMLEEEVIENQWEPLRIQFQLAQENYESIHKDFFQNLFQITTAFITRHFLVQRSSNETITFDTSDAKFFEEQQISVLLINQAYDADLLIFVVLASEDSLTYKTSQTYFKTDSNTKRPMVGSIKWNTFFLNLTNMTNSDFRLQTQRLIAASMRIMGFNLQSFTNYYNGSNNKTYSNVIQVEEQNTYLQTPRLTTQMKLHFNCSTITGANIEDSWDIGSQTFFLQQSIFYNEILTNQIMEGNMIISAFTFQLFQDTGFYNLMQYSPDYALWGKNKRCEFLNKKCDSKFEEFCKKENEEGCSFLNNGQSECKTYNQCMYFEMKDGQYCKDQSFGETQQNQQTFQHFGDDSMCIQGSMSKSENAANEQRLSCYKYRCEANFLLKLIIDNKEFVCGSKAPITNSQYFGKLTCPQDPEGFCRSQNSCQNQCNQKGYCLNKQCICKVGYSGTNCQDNCSNYRYKNECFDNCPKNTYAISTIKYCVGCPGNCQNCSNYNKCTRCSAGYKLNSLGFCDIVYGEPDSEEQEEIPVDPGTQEDEQYLELQFYYQKTYEYILMASIICLILQ